MDFTGFPKPRHPQHHSRLFSLPAELRIMIWDHTIYAPGPGSTGADARNVVRACRQAHNEIFDRIIKAIARSGSIVSLECLSTGISPEEDGCWTTFTIRVGANTPAFAFYKRGTIVPSKQEPSEPFAVNRLNVVKTHIQNSFGTHSELLSQRTRVQDLGRFISRMGLPTRLDITFGNVDDTHTLIHGRGVASSSWLALTRYWQRLVLELLLPFVQIENKAGPYERSLITVYEDSKNKSHDFVGEKILETEILTWKGAESLAESKELIQAIHFRSMWHRKQYRYRTSSSDPDALWDALVRITETS
jgi:hypothetical protein